MREPVAEGASAKPVPLSFDRALELVLCGLFLAGLSCVAHRLQTDSPRLPFLIGAGGGGLCVLWAIAGRCGMPYRLGAMATLVVMACVLACQAVLSWLASAEAEANGRMVTGLMMVLVVFCVGTLANLAKDRQRAHL